MGCFTSTLGGGGTKASVVIPVVGSTNIGDASSVNNSPVVTKSCASYPFMRVGLHIYCLDEFVSKYTSEKMYKWRPAEIVAIIEGTKNSVRVHFDGWSSKNDIVLDLDDHPDYIRLAPLGLLPDSQIASGAKLTPKQEKVVVAYIARHQDHFDLPVGPSSRRGSKPSLDVASSPPVKSTASSHGPDVNVETSAAIAAPGADSTGSLTDISPVLQFAVGESVDVQDEYKSKAAHPNLGVLAKKQSLSKLPWRPAVVREVTPDRVRVHYVGWDDSWDEVINITSAVGQNRICKGNQKSTLQSGGWDQFTALQQPSASQSNLTPVQRQQSGQGGKSNRRRKSQDNETMGQSADSGADLYRNPTFYRVKSTAGNTLTGSADLDNIPLSEMMDSPGRRQGSNLDGGGDDTGAVSRNKSSQVLVDRSNNSQSRGRLPKSPYQQRPSIVNISNEGADGVATAAAVVSPNGSALSRHSRRSFPGPGRVSSKEVSFEAKLAEQGMHVVEIVGDGNCLFRAVAHQMYLDENRHAELRKKCCEHMLKHKKRFEVFCSDNFESYIKHLSNEGVWGDHLEIKALEEIFDRIIIIYEAEGAKITPMNYVNIEEQEALNGKATSSYTTIKRGMEIEPILLSYHGRVHYNSVFNEKWSLPLAARFSTIIMNIRIKNQ